MHRRVICVGRRNTAQFERARPEARPIAKATDADEGALSKHALHVLRSQLGRVDRLDRVGERDVLERGCRHTLRIHRESAVALYCNVLERHRGAALHCKNFVGHEVRPEHREAAAPAEPRSGEEAPNDVRLAFDRHDWETSKLCDAQRAGFRCRFDVRASGGRARRRRNLFSREALQFSSVIRGLLLRKKSLRKRRAEEERRRPASVVDVEPLERRLAPPSSRLHHHHRAPRLHSQHLPRIARGLR